VTKPVVAYIAGFTRRRARRMGHADGALHLAGFLGTKGAGEEGRASRRGACG
jgi:succinyl-CoA synthetase alpha subunit